MRTASGTGAGASILNNQYQLAATLASSQVGTWQYTQARLVPVEPSWSTSTISIDWQMSTATNAYQSANLVLAPTVASGDSLSQPDYLRIRVQNGVLAVVRRVAGGTATTLWWANLPPASAPQEFRLQIDATNFSLYEGPPGAMTLQVGAMAHGLSWTAGYTYLRASNDAAANYTAIYDALEIDRQ